jgi:hypothetical protein
LWDCSKRREDRDRDREGGFIAMATRYWAGPAGEVLLEEAISKQRK